MLGCEEQFDSFCKKVLKNYARSYGVCLARHRGRVCFLEDISEDARLLQYFSTPSHEEAYIFRVMGIEIAVKNFFLGAALDELEENRRDIVLLAYCLEMTDQEIAEYLHSIRRTVTYRRSVALKQLKKLLGEYINGKKKSGKKNSIWT